MNRSKQAAAQGQSGTTLQAVVRPELLDLYDSYRSAETGDVAILNSRSAAPMSVSGDMVVVDIYTESGAGGAVLNALSALGLEGGAQYGRIVSGRLPIEAIGLLNQVDGVQSAHASLMTSWAGSVENQADQAMGTDLVRAQLGFDGTSTTVGIISDTFNANGGQPDGVRSGDLPDDVLILEDAPFGIDEGRAMAELVHDIAPDAKLQFHTALGGIANFAQGILDLAEAGADVIVDDIIYFAEPMFQDGAIALAADAVSAAGVPYFSSAGNGALNSFESAMRPVATDVPGLRFATYHDFDPGEGVDPTLDLTLPAFASIRFAFQWTDPAPVLDGSPGAATDLDIFLLDTDTGEVLASSLFFNEGDVPFEFVEFFNASDQPRNVQFVIEQFSGPDVDLFKVVDFGSADDLGAELAPEYPDIFGKPTNYGHANAENAIAVGAAFYQDTPAFGTDPAELEPFSALGGVPIYFAPDGTRLPEPVIRQKNDIVGPDGTNNTFFGGDRDGDGIPNFTGTSASAPHVAAVAALMLDANPFLTPAEILEILQSTALDMDDPSTPGFDVGFDPRTGAGYVQALPAVEEARARLSAQEATPDRLEDNDTPASATDLGTVDQPLTIDDLSIEPGDDDYIRFTTVRDGEAGDSIRIDFENPAGDLGLQLLSTDGRVLGSSDGVGDSETISLEALPAGPYIARVFGSDGQGNADYQLVIDPPEIPLEAKSDRIEVGENGSVFINVFDDNGGGADTGRDARVVAINGSEGDLRDRIELSSGALVSLNEAGFLTYNPAGAFSTLGGGETATDSFTYRIADLEAADSATVTVTVLGADESDDTVLTAQLFDAVNLERDVENNDGSFFGGINDPSGAVGTGHILNSMNASIEWYAKDGVLEASRSLAAFFGSDLSPFEPGARPAESAQVLYDPFADRYLALTVESEGVFSEGEDAARFLIAVSRTGDPNDGFTVTELDALTQGPDGTSFRPSDLRVSVDENAVYIVGADRAFEPIGFSTNDTLTIIDKGMGTGGLYDGGGATSASIRLSDALDPQVSGVAPVRRLDEAEDGAPAYLLQNGSRGETDDTLRLIAIEDTLDTPDFSVTELPVGDLGRTFSSQPAPQLGTPVSVSQFRSLGDGSAVQRGDQIYTAFEVLPEAGADAGQTTVFWAQIDVGGAAPVLVDQGFVDGEDIAPGTHTYNPGIAVDGAGTVAISFSASSDERYIGAYLTTRTADRAPGEVGASVLVREGVDPFEGVFGASGDTVFWSDRSFVGADPETDGVFWTYNLFADDPEIPELPFIQDQWGSAWGQFFIGDDPFVDEPPVAQSDRAVTSEDRRVSIDLLADNGSGEDTDSDTPFADLRVTAINGSSSAIEATITLPSGALLTTSGFGLVRYDPNGVYDDLGDGEYLTDSFTYTLSDGTTAVTATVTVTVEGQGSTTNTPPEAADDRFETAGALPALGNVLFDNGSGPDTDPEGAALRIEAVNGERADVGQTVTLASGAQVVLERDGTLTYTPAAADEEVTDSFEYTLADRRGLTDIATVSVTVLVADDQPTDGSDVLAGTGQDDVVQAQDGADKVFGGGGDDILGGGAGDDVMDGQGGNDLLLGGDGDDALSGSAGDDVLEGGAGDDTLSGGTGRDRLEGGEGEDLYLVGVGQGTTRIRDLTLESGEVDAIVFDASVMAEDVRLSRAGSTDRDLLISFGPAAEDTILVEGQFAAHGLLGIEEIRFADGSVLDRGAIDGTGTATALLNTASVKAVPETNEYALSGVFLEASDADDPGALGSFIQTYMSAGDASPADRLGLVSQMIDDLFDAA